MGDDVCNVQGRCGLKKVKTFLGGEENDDPEFVRQGRRIL